MVTAATFGVGTVFPAYRSVEALESKARSDDSQWLTYWVLMAFVAIAERFAYRVIPWLPFYAEMKLAFLCWLALPPFSGATLLYITARPLLVQVTTRLKTVLRQIRGVDDKVVKEQEHYTELRTRMANVENGVSVALSSLFNDVLAGDANEKALDEQLKKFESVLPEGVPTGAPDSLDDLTMQVSRKAQDVGTKAQAQVNKAQADFRQPQADVGKPSGMVHRVRASVPAAEQHNVVAADTVPVDAPIHTVGHDLRPTAA